MLTCLVESGETMRAAGLEAVDTVVSSTAVFVKARKATNPTIPLLVSRLRGVITAKKFVLCQYNIHRDQLSAATKIAPGKQAPTVTQLVIPDWVAVSVMVEKKLIATVMDELTVIGATDILVLDIANSRIN